LKAKEISTEGDSTSCGESIEEEVVTVKSNNIMESRNNDANNQKFQVDPPKNFSMSSTLKRRPDSLKLSFDYGSSTNLCKPKTAAANLNQSSSLPTFSTNVKKTKSYDLWVNENIEAKERSETAEKKLDLPGRVSFR
jgi:hypothetical protein